MTPVNIIPSGTGQPFWKILIIVIVPRRIKKKK